MSWVVVVSACRADSLSPEPQSARRPPGVAGRTIGTAARGGGAGAASSTSPPYGYGGALFGAGASKLPSDDGRVTTPEVPRALCPGSSSASRLAGSVRGDGGRAGSPPGGDRWASRSE